LSVKSIRTIEVGGAHRGKKKGAAAGVTGEESSSAPTAAAAGRGSGGGINDEKLAKLEKESRGKAAREMAKINPSASPQGQMSFDHISKMYAKGEGGRQGGRQEEFGCGTGYTSANLEGQESFDHASKTHMSSLPLFPSRLPSF